MLHEDFHTGEDKDMNRREFEENSRNGNALGIAPAVLRGALQRITERLAHCTNAVCCLEVNR